MILFSCVLIHSSCTCTSVVVETSVTESRVHICKRFALRALSSRVSSRVVVDSARIVTKQRDFKKTHRSMKRAVWQLPISLMYLDLPRTFTCMTVQIYLNVHLEHDWPQVQTHRARHSIRTWTRVVDVNGVTATQWRRCVLTSRAVLRSGARRLQPLRVMRCWRS